jgi:hypothetical protein
MRKTGLVLAALAALAATACAPAYYDRDYRYGYADRDLDGVPNAYDRDRDNDGVPNYADRRPSNPYRD